MVPTMTSGSLDSRSFKSRMATLLPVPGSPVIMTKPPSATLTSTRRMNESTWTASRCGSSSRALASRSCSALHLERMPLGRQIRLGQ
jgi:hypothetical protein